LPGPTIITDAFPDPVLEAEARKLKAPYLAPAHPGIILSLALQIFGRPAFPVHAMSQGFQEANNAAPDLSRRALR
jgi:hypothetical protein